MIPTYTIVHKLANATLSSEMLGQMQVNSWDNLMNTEDEAEIVFTYLGKKNNFTSTALSQGRTLTSE